MWQNTQQLSETLQKEMLVGAMTGRSYDETANEVAAKMGSAASDARRLIRTESTYVAGQAELEAYSEADIDQYEYLATLDKRTSEICQSLDGKVFNCKDAKPGVNCPPMHPYCRSTTIAHFDDGTLDDLERRARDPKTGETYTVPADMTYAEWKDGLEEMNGLLKLPDINNSFLDDRKQLGDNGPARHFTSEYKTVIAVPTESRSEKGEIQYKEYVTFDVEKANKDYEEFLTTVPESHRMYLQQAVATVDYEQREADDFVFGYSAKRDIVGYNPLHCDFWRCDYTMANTHELSHRIDTMFVSSADNKEFHEAIEEAKTAYDNDSEIILRYCKENDKDGLLSDIISAISNGESNERLPGHKIEYWKETGKKEQEIFANLYSLEALKETDKMSFVEERFPDIFNVFTGIRP